MNRWSADEGTYRQYYINKCGYNHRVDSASGTWCCPMAGTGWDAAALHICRFAPGNCLQRTQDRKRQIRH